MQIKTFTQFEKFLHSRIPTREALFQGDLGLKRAEYFMKLLGNPQNKLKVIHIAGTSGKGSTAYLMSYILRSQGFNVGLSISPHVLDIRERAQINNKLPNKKLILKYFNEILPVILKMESCKYGMPTFFEINVALAYHMFAKENLDYAIMETGLGGLLDATNVVESKNKLCIIAKLGLDHTEILGKTISEIAQQKAGIINKQNTAVSIQQSANALKVLKQICENKKSQLYVINENNYKIISHSPQKTIFDFSFSSENKKVSIYCICNKLTLFLKNLELSLIGQHQAQNCSLALASLAILSKRDNFLINEKKLRKSLENIHIPGRFETRNINGKTVIIDGAHNPQKMRALVKNLNELYPDKKFTFLVAFKKSKDYKKILLEILPVAEKIYLTRFSTKNMDGHWSSTDNDLIVGFLKSQNFYNFSIIKNKHDEFFSVLFGKSKNIVVITGSLYLVADTHKKLALQKN